MGGAERPVHFSNKIAYEYEKTTGRKYLADVITVFRQIETNAKNPDQEIEQALANISVVLLVDLVLVALKYAYRKEGIQIDFQAEDVSEWLLSDSGALGAVIGAIFESLPQPEQDDDAKKKRTIQATKTLKSTGKRK